MPPVVPGSLALTRSGAGVKKVQVYAELVPFSFSGPGLGSRQRNTFERDRMHGRVQKAHAASKVWSLSDGHGGMPKKLAKIAVITC